MLDGDQHKIEAMTELRFGKQIVERLADIKKHEMKFEADPSLIQKFIKKDDTDFGDLRGNLVSDNDENYIIDSMIIKGISPKRDENDNNFDYQINSKKDNDGMRFYMHKFFIGYQHYYQHLRFKEKHERWLEIQKQREARELKNKSKIGNQKKALAKTQEGEVDGKTESDEKEDGPNFNCSAEEAAEFIEETEIGRSIREDCNVLRKQMNDLTMRMFLRTTICFKNIGKFSATDNNKIYGDNYSGNHIAIFECELTAPPVLSFIDHTYEEYINGYRMNFKNWKIVDIDNFMEGNHYFSNLVEEKVWDAKMFDTLKTKTFPKYKEDQASSPLFMKEVLLPEMKDYVSVRMEMLDTNSNRNMTAMHKHRDQMIQNLEVE